MMDSHFLFFDDGDFSCLTTVEMTIDSKCTIATP